MGHFRNYFSLSEDLALSHNYSLSFEIVSWELPLTFGRKGERVFLISCNLSEKPFDFWEETRKGISHVL